MALISVTNRGVRDTRVGAGAMLANLLVDVVGDDSHGTVGQ